MKGVGRVVVFLVEVILGGFRSRFIYFFRGFFFFWCLFTVLFKEVLLGFRSGCGGVGVFLVRRFRLDLSFFV